MAIEVQNPLVSPPVGGSTFSLKEGACLSKYKIIDLFEGQKDLENKLVRTVRNPDERFSEDALRLIRAVRIAGQIGFKIEDKTLESIKKNAHLIKNGLVQVDNEFDFKYKDKFLTLLQQYNG